jgi:hypothetical protein
VTRRCAACGSADLAMIERATGYWRKECRTCGSTGPFGPPLSPADHEAREGERRYESWLETIKDHG